jgi:hypothetical protein
MTKLRTPRDAMVANLQQRLDAALAEARRQRRRAEDAERWLNFIHEAMPEQVKMSVGLH